MLQQWEHGLFMPPLPASSWAGQFQSRCPHKDGLFRTREWGAVVSPASEKLAEPKDVSYGTNSLGQLEDGKNVTSLLQVSLPAPLQPKLPQQ